MDPVLAKLKESQVPEVGEARLWRHALQQGDVSQALQRIRDFLSIPSEVAWCALALPMEPNEFTELSSVLSRSLQPPGDELSCFLLDQCINQDSYPQYQKLSVLISMRDSHPNDKTALPDYLDSDVSMYDFYKRTGAIQSPFLLYSAIFSAAIKRGKWNFAQEILRVFAIGSPAMFEVLLKEWELGTPLSKELESTLCCYLQRDWLHPIVGRTRAEDFLWQAFTRDASILGQCLSDWNMQPRCLNIINLIQCAFSDPVRFEQYGQEQGMTVDQCLDRLALHMPWTTDSRHDQFLSLYTWSCINNFTALQQRMSKQFAVDNKDLSAQEVEQHLQDGFTDHSARCIQSALETMIELSATKRYRATDEPIIQRLVAMRPECVVSIIVQTQHAKHNLVTCAAAHWSLETLTMLLDAGGSTLINDDTEEKSVPLYHALQRGDPNIVQTLLSRGAQIDALTSPVQLFGPLFGGQPERRRLNPLSILCEAKYEAEDSTTHNNVLECARLLKDHVEEDLLHHRPSPAIIEFVKELPNAQDFFVNRSNNGDIPVMRAVRDNWAPQVVLMLLHDTPRVYLSETKNIGQERRDSVFHAVMRRGDINITQDFLPLMTAEDTTALGRDLHVRENLIELMKGLVDIGGTDQLLIPDQYGGTPALRICDYILRENNTDTTDSGASIIISALECILDLLPDTRLPVFSIHKRQGDSPTLKKLCVFLLRRQMITMEQFLEANPHEGLRRGVQEEVQAMQRKRPRSASDE